jgi:hypothetical protein
LIRELGNSINLANNLEGNVITRFKTKADHCDETGNCNKTLERVLMDSKHECTKNSKTTSDEDRCLVKFNNDFYDKMHKLYEAECSQFRSNSFPLDCKNLATGFLNVFGDCKDQSAKSYFKNKWDYVLQLILGESSTANDLKKCECFDIAHSSFKQDSPHLEDIDNPGLNSTPKSHYTRNEDSFNTEADNDNNNTINSFNRPGKNATNFNHLSERPVRREMLLEMKVVSNDQISKEFTHGYEQRSTIIMDGALAVIKTLNDDILPMAHAKAADNTADTALNNRLNATSSSSSSKSSSVSIPDPFQNPVSLGKTDNSGHGLPEKASSTSSNQLGTKAENMNQIRHSKNDTSDSFAKGELTQEGIKSNGDFLPLTSTQGNRAGRDPATQNRLPHSGASDARVNDESPHYVFLNTSELLKFLTGPYQKVIDALLQPEFIKILIDHKVKVINHKGTSLGSRKPNSILQFNSANGSLNIVKWEGP